MNSDKFVLCRPEGGLNDCLNQIGVMLSYAQVSKRKLVVDTNYKYSESLFRDYFSHYFTSSSPDMIFANDKLISSFGRLKVFPEELQGHINDYVPKWGSGVMNFVNSATENRITFNVYNEYPHDVLVHQQCGGGGASIFALRNMMLNKPVTKELIRRLKLIGTPFTAVHIRNTDYATSIGPYFDMLRREVELPLFVATDNADTLAICAKEFGASNVISFSKLPKIAGMPIHLPVQKEISTFDRVVDAIVDVLCLAFSRKFIPIPIDLGSHGVTFSGFSMLAHGLRTNPEVLRGVLGESVHQRCIDACAKMPATTSPNG